MLGPDEGVEIRTPVGSTDRCVISVSSLFQIMLLLIMLSVVPLGWAADLQVQKAPVPVQAALMIKVLGFNKTITAKSSIKIQVLGNIELMQELKKVIGLKVGNGVVEDVIEGTSVDSSANVVVVDDESLVDSAVEAAKTSKFLVVTFTPELIDKGVVLGIGVKAGGTPGIFLSGEASKETGQDWDASLLKIAVML